MTSRGVITPVNGEDEVHSLANWLHQNRINSTKILDTLDQLGATEVIDLIDLAEEDVLKFQPPFLKKLEYVRFMRGIHSLKVSNGTEQKNDIVATSSATNIIPPIAEAVVMSSRVDELNKDHHTTYQRPPLPPRCPGDECSGILSSRLGTRKNKYLVNLDGPDFRWIVYCSECTRKWHACHFLCGHLQKISPLGSSDIIRHEQGRFNRWQKKIKPPCVKNPKNSALKASYMEQKITSKAARPDEIHSNFNDNHSTHATSETETVAKRADFHNIYENQSNHVPQLPSVPSSEYPGHPQFDNEFRTFLGKLDEGTLNFSDIEAADRMDEDFLDGCSDHEDATSSWGRNSNADNQEPANKRVKVTECPGEKQVLDDEVLNGICQEMNEKCRLQRFANKCGVKI